MWIEDVFLKSNQNESATRILLNDIPNKSPSVLFIPGDLVNLSYKEKRWRLVDSCLNNIRLSGISVHACLGNHELMGRKKKGERNFQTRFPDHVNTGYVILRDSIAVVFLNSNFSKMKREQIQVQDTWYNQTLQTLDSTAKIKVIIVSCHHSPYSDSKLVGSNGTVQKKFVPAFIQSKKCKIFMTGHAHLFQHFNVQGKDFLVIGGGGGLNHPLKKKSCGFPDLSPDYKPMFHYLTVTAFTDHLKISSHLLKEDFSGVEEGITFNVDLSK